ncbi:serine/threonine-protein kinase Nek5-like [Macrobrachium rosenbergii]|uniref:serine/threonine-protein kinase Nek5-like n=1 Tax=Macrobrachium rosenbergii TaxID=79674 RepID=UPI0034D7AD63
MLELPHRPCLGQRATSSQHSALKLYKMSDIKLIKKIGEGAFGKVYIGKWDGRKCAVKVITFDEKFEEIFEDAMKEVTLLSSLQHPNIVRFLDWDGTESDGKCRILIAVEYCGGGDLHTRIKNRRDSGRYFRETRVIGWFLDVVRAVEYLHSNGVIHRDIKPLNILKHEDGTIKLGDFGLAKILRSKKDVMASVRGTVIYSSPELHLRSVCDAKGDMWSLGCTLYELCKLEPAFGDVSEMLNFIEKRGTLGRLPGSYSSETKQLIKDLLSVDPDERPSASRVRKSLKYLLK